MKQKLLLIIFLLLGAYLRLANLPSRVPFDWDQERDILALEKIVNEKRPTLVGPVVRGEGGFMLGPLYTYLLLPGYLITGGNPLSAPITNIVIDLITGIGLYLTSSFAGIIWLLSPLIISNSLIAWNVGLIPIWTLSAVYIYKKYQKEYSLFLPYGSLLAGLSWHIHASIIPLSAIFLVYYLLKNYSRLNFKIISFSLFIYFLPLTPLILFDLRHDFVNLNLLKEFILKEKEVTYSIISVFQEVIQKYFQVLSSLFIKNIFLGILLFVLIVVNYKKNRELFSKIFLVCSAAIILALVLQGEINFPEYYFAVILVPAVLSIGNLIDQKYINNYVLILLFSLTLSSLSIGQVKSKSPYSLASKTALVNLLAQHPTSLNIRYELQPGRGSGIPYLLNLRGIKTQENSAIHIVIKDKPTPPNNIDNLPPTSIENIGPFIVETYHLPIIQ